MATLRTRDMHVAILQHYTRGGLPRHRLRFLAWKHCVQSRSGRHRGHLFRRDRAGDGSHHFSRTLAEHNAAVKRPRGHLKSRAGAK